jgi:cyclohexyl-isocyanide hydratase
MTNVIEIGMLLYPRLTQLDLTGPYEVLTRVSGARVHLLWKTLDPIKADSGLILTPTMTLAECPGLDVVFVPGGPGQVAMMDDHDVIEFLACQGSGARYVTSVCTGSLLLAAAGLLDGYSAACHWMSRDQLAALGVNVLTDRVVVDRNRITGGGVTAGIDFGLILASLLGSEHEARRIQLQIEYNPAPPFDAGSPETAGPDLVEEVKRQAARMLEARTAATERAKRRIRG